MKWQVQWPVGLCGGDAWASSTGRMVSETAENTENPTPNCPDIFVPDCLFFLIAFLFWYYEVWYCSWWVGVGCWSQRSKLLIQVHGFEKRTWVWIPAPPLTSSVTWASYLISPSLSVFVTKMCIPWSRIVVPIKEAMHINLWAYSEPQQLIIFLSSSSNARRPWTNLRLLFWV